MNEPEPNTVDKKPGEIKQSELLNWALTLLLPALAALVSMGSNTNRLATVEHLVEEQRTFHHISREEAQDLVNQSGHYNLDRESIQNTLAALKELQTVQSGQISSLRMSLEQTSIHSAQIDGKLDNIIQQLQEIRHPNK